MSISSLNYFGLSKEYASLNAAKYCIQPLPYERSTSYGKGTARGPDAIFMASRQVELMDEETGTEPFRHGIATLAPLEFPEERASRDCFRLIREQTSSLVDRGLRIISVGGEHTVTYPLVQAFKASHPGLQVVQFDAHADLRHEYEGDKYSHACVMARVRELVPTFAIGIRSLCSEERQVIMTERIPVWYGRDLESNDDWIEAVIGHIEGPVYVTFDVDFFDPSIMPATGTPEPGGGLWYPTLRMLRRLFEEKRVVGVDLVELSPIPDLHAPDFTAARLLYKMITYWQAGASGSN